ncbi:kinase-like protein [Marasmius fiardii PR-910]|nr:kinase-like protein [Marasmius fiardii PR-910]
MDPDVVTTERLKTTRLADGKKMVNQFVMDTRIGKGQHGIVWKCHDHLNPDKVFAMKIVKRDNPKAKRERQYKQLRQQNLPPRTDHVPVVDGIRTAEQEIRKEIAIMKKCRHPHVVRLHEVIDDRKNDQIFMVIEYLGGGEINYTNGNHEPILTVEQTRRIMRDALLGLEYLHHQGIIHRDIKPANLIWTTRHDRVKIVDFGTAHFSYAQRLSSARTEGVGDSSSAEEDPILLNDADLAKRAGSPAFLAPEIVWEYSKNSTGPRPSVTKAIDIWALGVTLYCFLFGKTPFRPPGQHSLSEWTGYDYVCNHDWRAPATMGYDKVRTGGRHPNEDETDRGELGPVVIHLLDHFLKKDVEERITIEEVKANRWFLLDLPNPSTWLEVTSPNPIQVSQEETSGAMSKIHFRWSKAARSRTAIVTPATSANVSGTATSATTPTKRGVAVPLSNNVVVTGGERSPASQGGMGIAKRLAALLSRSNTTPAITPTSASPPSVQPQSVTNILGIRMHRSQNALGANNKKVKKPKVKKNAANGDRGRVTSEPNVRLRRVKSDREADAQQERREKKERERERRRRLKMAEEAVREQSKPTPGSNKGKGREPVMRQDYACKRSDSTPKPHPAVSDIGSSQAPSPSRPRSGSMRSVATGDQRSASPSGKRLTGLLSTITLWRPSSRASHHSSPVEERMKGKKKSKDSQQKQRSSSGTGTGTGTSESEMEFAAPGSYQPAIVSSMDDLRHTLSVPVLTPPVPQARGPSSRSSSSAALFTARSGASGSRSGSTSPPVLSPTFATAVISGGHVIDAVPHIGGVSSSAGSNSSSSFGGLANRRISSWDQVAAADDSRSFTSSYQSDDLDFDEDDDGVDVEGGVRYYTGDGGYGYGDVDKGTTAPTQSSSGGIIFMRDEVDNYSDSGSEDDGDRDDQGTCEGTIESTVEGRTDADGYQDSAPDHREKNPDTDEEGLTFSTRRRRDGR